MDKEISPVLDFMKAVVAHERTPPALEVVSCDVIVVSRTLAISLAISG